ncbi:hypothetical protein O5O45_06870 [Hahella aquimaris]|uniref:hypothetical protein n=1 Tax=Hahella sp. HNIBRBA332 TaxID=3015983 RepID=UPI00273B7877|nr:hypothetical protein [Hahella sp. HNIBRBA332]WLQ15637.1 hypothetical protein O5O45_06870 [Hahella sp. HNIBRBA332]
MKKWITNNYRLSRLFILEQVREPLTLFWTLIAPPLLFVFLNLDPLVSGAATTGWYEEQASWYLSYLALSVSLFGFALYFVGRRESGFIKSFIQGKEAKALFLSAQISASLLLSCFCFIVFIVITTVAFGVSPLDALTRFAIPFLIIMVTFVWSALFISVLPLTFMNANSGISIFFMALLMFSIAGFKANIPALSYLNLFNPLSIATQFMASGGLHSVESIGTIALMTALGGVGLVRMKTSPTWSRQ